MAEITANKTENLIGLEITRSLIKAVCVTKNGDLLATRSSLIDATQPTLEQIVSFINDLKTHFGSFTKIGIAVPGLFDQKTKRIAYSTYIPEHSEVDLLQELETATSLKILIENDANAAAIGEFQFGAGRDSQNMFYVMLGIGVGGALILNGQIWRGASGFAGEFGYMAINSEGLKIEDMASTANIVRRTRNRYHQDSTSSLSKFEEEEITLTDIVREAKKDDDFAKLMLERTGNYIGTAIAGVINLLNIEKIVVGGEIMQAENIVLDAIIARAKELSFKPSFETVQIVEGILGENASAIGAALLAVEKI